MPIYIGSSGRVLPVQPVREQARGITATGVVSPSVGWREVPVVVGVGVPSVVVLVHPSA